MLPRLKGNLVIQWNLIQDHSVKLKLQASFNWYSHSSQKEIVGQTQIGGSGNQRKMSSFMPLRVKKLLFGQISKVSTVLKSSERADFQTDLTF